MATGPFLIRVLVLLVSRVLGADVILGAGAREGAPAELMLPLLSPWPLLVLGRSSPPPPARLLVRSMLRPPGLR